LCLENQYYLIMSSLIYININHYNNTDLWIHYICISILIFITILCIYYIYILLFIIIIIFIYIHNIYVYMVTDMNIFKHIYIYNEICKNVSLYVNIHTIIYRHCIYIFILKIKFSKDIVSMYKKLYIGTYGRKYL
jgi:hypothetical protein